MGTGGNVILQFSATPAAQCTLHQRDFRLQFNMAFLMMQYLVLLFPLNYKQFSEIVFTYDSLSLFIVLKKLL